MYVLLDILFLVFHSALVAFNLTGWIWRKTRPAHLVTMSLTMVSWFGLGLLYGFGYCPCTDWHWQVKRRLGGTNLPVSYVKYYADAITGLDCPRMLVDGTVLVLGLAAFGLSILLNRRDRRNVRSAGTPGELQPPRDE